MTLDDIARRLHGLLTPPPDTPANRAAIRKAMGLEEEEGESDERQAG